MSTDLSGKENTSGVHKRYFYAIGGQQDGPLGLTELRAMAEQGRLKRTDKVWAKGMASWQPAGTVSEIFQDLPPDLEPELPPPLDGTDPGVATVQNERADVARKHSPTLPSPEEVTQHKATTVSVAAPMSSDTTKLVVVAFLVAVFGLLVTLLIVLG